LRSILWIGGNDLTYNRNDGVGSRGVAALITIRMMQINSYPKLVQTSKATHKQDGTMNKGKVILFGCENVMIEQIFCPYCASTQQEVDLHGR
jgi:hypothetical protein